MKKNIRFYVSILLTRILTFGMRLIGKKATYFPGKFALSICPDFLKMISKPKKIICVTGTNGKTSTSNMLTDVLVNLGEEPLCNRAGSNMASGIASSLLNDGTSFWGKSTKELAIFEVDERSSKEVYSAVKPNYIIVTNLFRDTIRREANTDFIFEIIDKNLPKNSTLILNSDEIISASLGKHNENKKIYYSVKPLKDEKECKTSLVKDSVYDFDTETPYEYEFQRYHHVGRIKNFSPKADYELKSYAPETRAIEISCKGKTENYLMIDKNETTLYNQLVVISTLKELGYTESEINESFKDVSLPKSRYEETIIKDKKVILFLSKGCASVAASRVVKHIADYPGRTCVIMMNEEEYALSYYNSWFYEIDYAIYQRENIKQIVIGGYYCKDFHLCLLLQDVQAEKITSEFKHLKTPELVNLNDIDNIFVVYGLDTIMYKDDIKSELIKRIKNEC